MEAQVVYYTKSGNTKKLADAIGSAIQCPVTTTDTPLTTSVDVLFLGASVYKFGIDRQVISYINQLDRKQVGCVALFSTSAQSQAAFPKMKSLLAERGISVLDQHFYCPGKFLMVHKHRPNQEDVQAVKQFAQSVVALDC